MRELSPPALVSRRPRRRPTRAAADTTTRVDHADPALSTPDRMGRYWWELVARRRTAFLPSIPLTLEHRGVRADDAHLWAVPAAAWSPNDTVDVDALPAGAVLIVEIDRPKGPSFLEMDADAARRRGDVAWAERLQRWAEMATEVSTEATEASA